MLDHLRIAHDSSIVIESLRPNRNEALDSFIKATVNVATEFMQESCGPATLGEFEGPILRLIKGAQHYDAQPLTFNGCRLKSPAKREGGSMKTFKRGGRHISDPEGLWPVFRHKGMLPVVQMEKIRAPVGEASTINTWHKQAQVASNRP